MKPAVARALTIGLLFVALICCIPVSVEAQCSAGNCGPAGFRLRVRRNAAYNAYYSGSEVRVRRLALLPRNRGR